MSSRIPRNNAFGANSPSWNLPFPSGNLTAAEMLAYVPHTLKSIDVIDRFIMSGGRAYTIAAMINEFRYQPQDRSDVFPPNSAQIMMSCAMRRAGYKDWKIGTHHKFERPNPNLEETDLNVQTFRLPLETHPKSSLVGEAKHRLKRNKKADPVDFKSLALNVKAHPTGSDALDLTRCVLYALSHPKETFYYPTDFGLIVKLLGGPATINDSHLDREIFRRREEPNFSSPAAFAMARSRRLNTLSSAPASGSPLKRVMDADDFVETAGRRKSGRLANKARVDLREYGSDSDKDEYEPPQSGFSTPAKKRKFSRIPATPGSPSNDSDFFAEDSEPDEEIHETEMFSDDDLISPLKVGRGRAAARKARQVIRGISTETKHNIESLTKQKSKESPKSMFSPQQAQMLAPPTVKPSAEVSPEMMSFAKGFPMSRQPVFLEPPYLSKDRLRIDSTTIYLYAADGCSTLAEMWDSALSSTRFNGPRRHPPFRELHRLTEPPVEDISDWAENIRWAKEQYAVFGSIWTEYDYHLEQITEHRRMSWISEEAITGRRR